MNYETEQAQKLSLQSLDYKLTTADYAFIILNSNTYTLNQKIAMLREIMLSSPNCAISSQLGVGNVTLHEFLDETIDRYEMLLAEFYSVENCVYSVIMQDVGDYWQFATLKDLLNDLPEADKENGFTVRKQQLSAPFKKWIATYNRDGEIMELTVTQRQQEQVVTAKQTVPFEDKVTAVTDAACSSDKSKGITLATSYSNLTDKNKRLFDRIIRTVSALSKKTPDTPITRFDYNYCIAFMQGNIKVGRLSISNGTVIFECKVANTELKNTTQSEIAVKSHRYKVVDGKTYHVAMEAFDTANQLAIGYNKR